MLKSNGLRHPKNLTVKFGFSPKTVPANIAKKLPLQRCSKPFLIPLFNFAHKCPTFAFAGKSGYTLGFPRKIAHSGLHAEARVLHSCCYLAHLTSLSHFGKEKPEEADARLWRASASPGTAAPPGCVVLLFVCQHCAPLALFVALAGYQSPFRQRTMPYSGKEGEESQESLS